MLLTYSNTILLLVLVIRAILLLLAARPRVAAFFYLFARHRLPSSIHDCYTTRMAACIFLPFGYPLEEKIKLS
ncbi:uncharacterized protein EDB91DRAFT_1111934 [Suillus paluster]|uniref:uncharacterized protein n=1 Tax=Suillus paluster TaxID=48578 RepID=UPI001B877924|nr:uncharacterized protein EDB91DRAFT_1111934 [Suillus paluster]KAG1749001.1 hypothetical protein EDB91DRAFT_1111934 [Suillus paluster]